jgi:copper chaperone CopZ
MRMHTFLSAAVTLTIVAASFADEPGAKPAIVTTTTNATYAITGLHCPPCTRTVEASLRKTKGVKSAKVDWTTKSAKVTFDESMLPAQQLAQAIAKTPHMMGGGMHYAGWLALKIPDLKDDATAKTVKEALGKVAGKR